MKNKTGKVYRPFLSTGITFAILLLVAGALLLLTNFGVFPTAFRKVIWSWQMLLIVIGFSSLNHRHFFSGLICIIIGGFFMMPRLAAAFPQAFSFVDVHFTATYWPILLIIAGLLLIVYWFVKPKRENQFFNQNANHASHQRREHRKQCGSSKKTDFHRDTVFGDVTHTILEPEFTGGDVNAVFGGVTLDLRRTNLPAGNTYLEINAVFGGITVYVPDSWTVEFNLSTVFGNFSDTRIRKEPLDETRKLIIEGSCVFGGGELRN